MRVFLSLFLFIFISACAGPGMQRAVIFDASDNQIIAAEFPNGSTVKFEGPSAKLEVVAPTPKPSIIADMTRGISTAIVPFFMINTMDD